jgi:predicted DsbA family dithiol-disulfide isomerase
MAESQRVEAGQQAQPAVRPLRVDIWSDIACPWCYVGKRRFEAALASFAERDSVQVVWRSFQLDPSAPRTLPEAPGYAERLAKKYGTTPAQGAAMINRMTETARLDGIAMDFDHIRPGNTFDAHRLLHWAHRADAQDALKERLFRAYLCEGKPIGEPDTLLGLVADLGLDVDGAQAVLATDAHAADVRADVAQARALGIDGVPFFVVGQRYGVSGAQSADTLRSVLERWCEENAALTVLQPPTEGGTSTSAEGEVCGPEGCGPDLARPPS